ncbi:hypothetical protein RHECNPAF_430076 [Rhizobium etli CNPAF512]|nr:hypothetical protein RHECNPAF_430076 [Rhizobium etli CNPAF512]
MSLNCFRFKELGSRPIDYRARVPGAYRRIPAR